MLEQQLFRVIEALCDDIATPRANLVKGLVQRGEWTELQQLRCRPDDYSTPEDYFKDAVVTDLLRKTDLPSKVDKRKVATDVFYRCEAKCKHTNDRLLRFLPENLLIETPEDNAFLVFLQELRKEVRHIVGRLPHDLSPAFGPGATFGDKGLLVTIPDKMSSRPTITPGASWLKDLWRDTAWCKALMSDRPWLSEPEVVRGNRFTTVPKDAEKHRGICIEPSLNISYQLPVGRVLKKRLLENVGIDLHTGQDLHRRLARDASVLGHLATADQSNASDTVSYVAVKLLFPADWFALLDGLRSAFTLIDGRWVRLEKFSSMGNGFTFELETVIFLAIARVVTRRRGSDVSSCYCYGDDLIVPSEVADDLAAALSLLGFEPNLKKTFKSGPFRESCGGDFFEGTPVRAYFLSELPNEPQDWIGLANGIRRMAFGDNCPRSRWHFLHRAWRRCLDALPSNIRRLRGPTHLGDVVIHDDNWALERLRDGPDRFLGVKAYCPIPVILQWNNWTPAVQFASALKSVPSDGVTPRGGVAGFRIKSLPVIGVKTVRSHVGPRYHRGKLVV